MRKNRSAQGLSLNVVVIAAIALLVLVVLGVVFLQGTSEVPTKLKGCVASGGVCTAGDTCSGGFSRSTNADHTDCAETSICCLSNLAAQG
jgi:hypothetical protein